MLKLQIFLFGENMKTLVAVFFIVFIAILAHNARSQSSALPAYPVILSTATTGTYACPAGASLPCAIPVTTATPLPTTTTGN
jgi:hypothetical protein